jgi:hypothetical protein
MTRFILDRSTGALLPYPRQDNEPVVGLDRTAAYVVEVVRNPEPNYNPATPYLSALDPVISITNPDSEDINGTVVYGWEVAALPSTAILPNWSEFRNAIFTENGYVTAHVLALESGDDRTKFAATGLFTFLSAFERTGDYSEYFQALLLTISASPPVQQAVLAQEFFYSL